MHQFDAEQVKAAASIEKIIGERVVLKRAGPGELTGLCPFHKEKTPSFTVTPSKGAYHCFGCQAGGDVFSFVSEVEGIPFGAAVQRVAEMAGIAPSAGGGFKAEPPKKVKPQITATFEYVDEQGELLYEVCRVEPGMNGRKKDFWQRRKHPMDGEWVWGVGAGAYRKRSNGEWHPVKDEGKSDDDELPEARQVLYRLPDVLMADTVYITEGEKDAGTLETWGYCGTTNSGGAAKKWSPEYTEVLRGKCVVIVPDLDEPGIKRARMLEQALRGVAKWAITVQVPAGKDVTEYAEAGGTAEEFGALVEATRHDIITRALEDRGLLSPAEILDTYDGGATAFLDPSKRKPGLMTGYTRLDQMTNGFRDGQLILLAGRPAMGKTALGVNIAENVVASTARPVAVFSLEMSRDELLIRMICARAGVDQTKYRAGFLNREERIRAQKALLEIYRMPIGIDDQALADVPNLERKLELFRQRAGDLALVVIDYIQLMSPPKRRGEGNRTQDVSEISRGLKLLAKKMRVPIIALSQLSRGPESRPGDHRPQLNDLRDSGSLEQDADMVMFVYREEYYKRQDPNLMGKAELIMAKQRNGPIGTIKLAFQHSFTRFDNLADEPPAN